MRGMSLLVRGDKEGFQGIGEGNVFICTGIRR